jgi:N-acetylmuramoyl-L-alanine amidase
MRFVAVAVAVLALGLTTSGPGSAEEPRAAEAGRVVIIDPGHGGADYGARGPDGALEKHVALAVARALGAELAHGEASVVYTRESDRFVSLVERTEIATRARGDLFVSIHANASADPDATGIETYFLSSDASDEDALRVAQVENATLEPASVMPGNETVVGGILGDLLWTAYLEQSSRLAAHVQRRMARLPGPSRGVKQAPFVVLMGVNMPSVLVEIGFLTNSGEATRLSTPNYQRTVARSLAAAVEAHLEEDSEVP